MGGLTPPGSVAEARGGRVVNNAVQQRITLSNYTYTTSCVKHLLPRHHRGRSFFQQARKRLGDLFSTTCSAKEHVVGEASEVTDHKNPLLSQALRLSG